MGTLKLTLNYSFTQLYIFKIRLDSCNERAKSKMSTEIEKKDFLLSGGNSHIVFNFLYIVQWHVGIF